MRYRKSFKKSFRKGKKSFKRGYKKSFKKKSYGRPQKFYSVSRGGIRI